MEMHKEATLYFQERADAKHRARQEYLQSEETDHRDVRLRNNDLMAGLSGYPLKPPLNPDGNTGYQLALSASFFRSYFLIDELILEGELIEAFTLIRKQLETLERIVTIEKMDFKALEGKVAKIKNIEGMKRAYGFLSTIAHFGKFDVIQFLNPRFEEDKTSIHIFPAYQEEAHDAWNIHTGITFGFMAWFIEKIETWYPGTNLDFEKEYMTYSARIAEKSGVFELRLESE